MHLQKNSLSSIIVQINIQFQFEISTMEEQIDQIEELYNRIPQQLIAHLTTSLQKYQLPHQQLQLSSELDEEALNQLLKDMLEQSDLPRFQFIVQGHLLRGKLKSHILRYELTAQQTMTIEYVISFPQLEKHLKAPQDDWISAVTTVPGPQGINAVAAALYSGVVSIYTPNLKIIGKFTADDEPLKALQFLPGQSENSYFCLTGGLSQNLKINLFNLKQNKLEAIEISNIKHNGSINCIAVSPGTDSHIATGGSNGQLNIWQIPEGFEEAGKFNSVKNKKKKKEITQNVLPLLASETIHNGTIECLTWITNQEVITGSGEHNFTITNIVRMEKQQTFYTRDSVVTSIDTFMDNILSAHEDGQLRLWDRRDPSRPVNTFKGHSKWASSIRFGKTPFHFASGSFDHTVKIWDMRCNFPLQNIQTQQQKVLGVQWTGATSVVSGGSDSVLHLHRSI